MRRVDRGVPGDEALDLGYAQSRCSDMPEQFGYSPRPEAAQPNHVAAETLVPQINGDALPETARRAMVCRHSQCPPRHEMQ